MTIQYNFQMMNQLADDLGAEKKILVTQSETLETEVRSGMDDAWQSDDAKGKYDQAQNRWNGEFRDTQDILDRLITAVRNSASSMQSTDTTVGNSFPA